MEDYGKEWEERRRAELMLTTPEGAYKFSIGEHRELWTGKGGAIDIQIEMERSGSKLLSELNIEPTRSEEPVESQYSKITKEKIEKLLKDMLYGSR